LVALRVLLTVPDTPEIVASAHSAVLATPSVAPPATALPPALPASLQLDHDFPAVPLGHSFARQAVGLAAGTGASPEAFVVRAVVDDSELGSLTDAMRDASGENHVFADPGIGHQQTCGGDPPVGTALDVQRLLGAGRLRQLGMDGRGVAVAIVDNGINLNHLRARGFAPTMNWYASWSPSPTIRPGAAPVDHGTMCACAALLTAPAATLIDYSLLRSTRPGGSVMDGVLSDAVQAYGLLLGLMMFSAEERFFQSLVVNNSWGMFHPSWDFPAGHPGRYHDNPGHPFNVVVGSLAAAGADILFAAGNCGPVCPDGRCQPILPGFRYVNGANSHPEVYSVAGVDTNRLLVGYSSHGPGVLAHDKPDIASYTHFLGSEAFGQGTADSGTSTACPVAAGVVAALRSAFPFDPAAPSRAPGNVRAFVLANAVHPAGAPGWTPDFGRGIIDTAGFVNAGAVL
jgi:subtilisin family serine protease